jgi:glutamate-1-semialdehyde 2,1-aminomutase
MSLDESVAAARQRYVAAHPRSAELAERAGRVMPGGNTRATLHFEPFAFRVDRADGAHLHDVDGHTYLDLLGDYSAGLLGRRGEVADVIRAVLDRGWSYGAIAAPEAAFAEAVVGRFPSIDQVRFTNSGTEANVMALLTARHATGRDRVVVFAGAYHGGLLNFTPGSAPLRAPFEFAVLPYNDVDAVEAEFAAAADRVAGVLVEPMMGAAGCIPGDPAFLAALRRVTTASGSLLIFDEVMTSRLAVGGAQELLGITPDLTTLGKYLAGGLSFGAFGGRRDLMAAYDPRAGGLAHGGTFNNNAFTMAVGAAVHESLIDAATLATVNKRGDVLRDGLNAVLGDSPLPFTATGWGSFVNIHPVRGAVRTPADLSRADPRWRELFFFELLEAGFYVAPRGYLALTMDVTDDDVAAFLGAVGEFCRRNVVIAFPGHAGR